MTKEKENSINILRTKRGCKYFSSFLNNLQLSEIVGPLKLVSPNNSPLKVIKNIFFISSKTLFLFSRYLTFCNFFPSFPHFPDSKEQMEVE